MAAGIEIVEALSRELPEHRRLSRGLHGQNRQAHREIGRAEMVSNRRLLVSARRHPDRRVLAEGKTADGPLGAGSGCAALSGAVALSRHPGRARTREARDPDTPAFMD